MVNYAHRSTIFCLFASFWLLTAITPIFGGGSQDADLSKADALINEKKYDEAILVLTDYARRNPGNFDLAQKRFRSIYSVREEFNRTADELIHALLNDPDNSVKILALSTKLKSLESDTSPLVESFVSRTQEIAQFNVDRNRMMNILERGRAALDRGDSEAALVAYASGMDFMRNEFYSAGYGENTENIVRRETERVNTTLESFRAESAPLSAISAELIRALNAGNLAAAGEIITRLSPAMDRFIRLNNELYTAVNQFDSIFEELKVVNPEMGDRNHLSFISRVIHGRSGEEIQEGMLGAFSLFWKNSAGAALAAITQNAETANSTALAAFSSGDYPAASTAIDSCNAYINLSSLFFEKSLQFHAGGRPQLVLLFDRQIIQDDLAPFTKLKSQTEAGNYLKQTAALKQRLVYDDSSITLWQQGRINITTALTNERQTKDLITGIQNEVENIIRNAAQMDALISNYQSTVYIKNALNAINEVNNSITAERLKSAHRYYTIGSADLRNNVTVRREELEKGRNYLNGQNRANTDGTAVERYPTEALETLNTMLTALSGDLERGNTLTTSFRNEPAAIASDKEITSAQNIITTAINELTGIRSQGLALADTARGQTALAEAYRQEGERLLGEAQTAYQRQNFAVARDRLQRATDRFNNSLEIQESASLRRSWDTQMINLGQRINVAENETIIVEVRNLVNTARVAYFAGDFQSAEDNLVRARNRWRVTNADENEEVVYWIGIVRGAMSARSGRVIPATAPLYPEMSQLLSEARKNYEEGVRLINSGQRVRGLEKFKEAQRLTREVRLIFPVNQEAGILELRMEQFTDPAAFNAAYEQRLRTAVAGTKQRSIESFADLQNLAEINPNYRGIRGILNQAEIDMGYRPPPPNPRDLARSRELTTSASRILEGNSTSLFEVALSQINEAIALNPENAEATRVKDRLLNRMSVPGAIVLTSDDEDEYQRAVRELQAGNNLVALALVERLMQNPRNRNITKLIELQRRIQSVL